MINSGMHILHLALGGLLWFGTAGLTVAATQEKSSQQAAESADETYRKLVRPYLQKHCTSCHGPESQEADFRIDKLNPDIQSGPDIDAWNLMRLRLVTEEMPPSDSPRPIHGQSQQVISWLTRELTLADATLLNPKGYNLPVNGNRVNHQLLFSGTIKGPAATRARVWRQSPFAYEAMTKGELAKNVRGIAQPFSVFSAEDIKDYASGFSIDESTASQLMRNAALIVASQTRGEMKEGKWSAKGYPQPVKEFVRLFEAGTSASRELQNAAIEKQFALILRRKPSDKELERYCQLMERSIKDSGLVPGVRVALSAILLTPEAVFRFELGAGKPDKHGRKILSPRELAFAISYALTDKAPDSQLLRAAAEGKLASANDVEHEVARIFDHPKTQKPRILRFFQEYFGYRRAKDVFKDNKLNPHHRADVLVGDTEQLILWILERDQDVFEELLTTNKSFVNYRFDTNKKRPRIGQAKQMIHTSYGLPLDWKWTDKQPVELPAAERAGILTQPSWLVTMSGNFDNHPILRGKWIRERLLGGTIPDLPITVDAQLPDEPHHTLRHRMRVTRESYCWNCHQRMNPLGLTFEIYDHFGRFRTLEKVVDIEATKLNVDRKGNPLGEIMIAKALDSTGSIELVGDARVERKVNDAVAMIKHLAKTDRARQMFIRYTFRYFMGRNEELSDSPTLIQADKAYRSSGGSFRTLVKSLLTSDSFLYRITEPSEKPASSALKPENSKPEISKTEN